jgi:Putative auto-transporter adhesin, head GIN domain
MKKLIIMAVSLLTLSAASFAGNGSEKKNTEYSVVVKTKAPFQMIVLNNGVDLVLTESSETRIEIKGEEKDVNNVAHSVKKGILYIGVKNASLKTKAVVYVSMSQLESIEVNGKSKITSNGFLKSSKLKVVVNDEAKFDLKNYGKILFEADDEIDLNFEKSIGQNKPVAFLSGTDSIKQADEAMDTQITKEVKCASAI